MRFCVRCGAEHRDTERFCMSCGWRTTGPAPDEQAPDADATDPADAADAADADTAVPADPARPYPRWLRPTPLVMAWITAAVLVAAGTVGVLVYRATVLHPDAVRLPPDFVSVPSDSDRGAATDTDDPTDSLTPTPDPTPTDPNGVVVLAGPVTSDPDAAAVMSLVSRYFLAINTRDYQLYYRLHTTSAQLSLDPETFRRGYRSTRDTAAVITDIGAQLDGDPLVKITFTSEQDAVDGQFGETCDRWHITLFLLRSGDLLQIDGPPNGYQAEFEPC